MKHSSVFPPSRLGFNQKAGSSLRAAVRMDSSKHIHTREPVTRVWGAEQLPGGYIQMPAGLACACEVRACTQSNCPGRFAPYDAQNRVGHVEETRNRAFSPPQKKSCVLLIVSLKPASKCQDRHFDWMQEQERTSLWGHAWGGQTV